MISSRLCLVFPLKLGHYGPIERSKLIDGRNGGKERRKKEKRMGEHAQNHSTSHACSSQAFSYDTSYHPSPTHGSAEKINGDLGMLSVYTREFIFRFKLFY